jgi:hypothetical protein
VDSNLLAALRPRHIDPSAANLVDIARANRLKKVEKLIKKQDGNFHYYIAQRTAREMSERGAGRPIYFPSGTRIFPTIEPRAHNKAYETLTKFLEEKKVGEMKPGSFKDREIIADLFFAKKSNPSDIPTFATADQGIFRPMCELVPKCRKLGGDRLKIISAFPDGFEVTIQNRTIRILPFL